MQNISHPSRKSIMKLITDPIVWHNIKANYNKWAKTCIAYQRFKILTHTKAPISNIPVKNQHFSHIDLDLNGPLPISQNFTCFFTIIERFTHWVEAEAFKNIEAETAASAFYKIWITLFKHTQNHNNWPRPSVWMASFSLFGQFVRFQIYPNLFLFILRQTVWLKIKLANTLKSAYLTDKEYLIDRRTRILPAVLLGLRATFRQNLRCIHSELIYGQTIRLLGEFFHLLTAISMLQTLLNCLTILSLSYVLYQLRCNRRLASSFRRTWHNVPMFLYNTMLCVHFCDHHFWTIFGH